MNTEPQELDDETCRINALAKYLNCEPSDISPATYGENTFELGSKEYLVLTDEEADTRAHEYCEDTLWAFSASFLTGYIENDDRPALEKSIQCIQEKMCESCNPTIKAMLGSNLKNMIDDAISCDGRGHFLSGYDGNENEEGDYYIYRVN